MHFAADRQRNYFRSRSFWILLLLGACLLWSAYFPNSAEVKEAASSPQIPANQTAKLKELVGREVVVSGRVSRIHRANSGHIFIQFYSSDLGLVCFPDDSTKFKDLFDGQSFKDQDVLVSGRMELYRDKPQIKLRDPKQLRRVTEKGDEDPDESQLIADTQAAKEASIRADRSRREAEAIQDRRPKEAKDRPESKKFALKQIDDTTWLSPAGLRYAGRDPEGLTRVEHVMRHAEDEPTRAGSHGVFDGGADVALAVIDEAWQRVKKDEIRPEKEGNRSSYTIPMGRRIGYLGGELGARKKHPPLQRVFIVVKSGTADVVTAYPR